MKFYAKQSYNHYYNSSLSLTEYARVYETDKGNSNSLDLSWGKLYPQHMCLHYITTYEKYMQCHRHDPVSMMEIGVCDKRFPFASVKMWMSFFEFIDFFAVDNFWGTSCKAYEKDIYYLLKKGANFIYADQGSFSDWEKIQDLIGPSLDFIIEDGSHWPNHMMISLWKSIPLLKQGGYYFMEDIQNPLKSRGWYKYDNSLIAEELLKSLSTKVLQSSFLNDQQNKDIQNNLEFIELVLDSHEINYLAIFRRK